MNLLSVFLWASVGIVLAMLYIKTQKWSVAIINPNNPRFSKGLIIGGAIIRWLITAIFLLITLNHSIGTMLIFFSAFMIARMVIVFRQQRLLA